MKLLIINNLSAGYADGAIHDYIRTISRDGDEQCIRCTDGTTPIADLVADAKKFDAVIVSGGDGTTASVAYALAHTGVPIQPYPAGTANLLAINLLSPYEPHALAKMTREMQTLDFDLGEMEVDGKRFGFSIMAGAGYDATIMKGAKPAKKLLGPMAYFQAAITNPLPQRSKITLDLDGRIIESEGLGVLLVNFSKIQFDITVTHKNEPRDGEFDVVILKADNAFELIPALFAGILDRDGAFPTRTDSLEMHRGRHVRVTCDPPLQVQFDGEVPGCVTPFSARVLKGAARFVVSSEGYKQFSTS